MRSLRITVAAITLATGVVLGIRADGAEEPAAPAPTATAPGAAAPAPDPAPAPATPEERADEAEERAKIFEGIVNDLTAENNNLKVRNRALELQLKQLREQVPALAIPQAQPRVAPPADRLPPGSVPREYNGIRFYVIPLSDAK